MEMRYLYEFLDRYFFSEMHHTSCSVIETKYCNNVIEESSIVKQTNADDDSRQCIINSDNNHIGDYKDTIPLSKSCSSYRYTPQQIDKFFASNYGQEEEHSFEGSICRPLVGQQNYKPFFMYCKLDPNVENINLKSIEDHIRPKDPQRYKAKLLEMIQGEYMDL